jgi:hypothetical protein
VLHVGRTPSHWNFDHVRVRTTTTRILSVLALGNLPLTYASDSVDRRLVFVYALAFPDLLMILDIVLLWSMWVVVMMVGMVGILAKALASSKVLREPRRCLERLGNSQRVAVRAEASYQLWMCCLMLVNDRSRGTKSTTSKASADGKSKKKKKKKKKKKRIGFCMRL